MAEKYAIIIQAGQQDVGRAVHGLLYGKELHEDQYEVKIFFDGAGTHWIGEFEKADFPFHDLYKEVRKSGIITGACAACSNFFDNEEDAKDANVELISDSESGQFSLVKLLKSGYTPIIL